MQTGVVTWTLEDQLPVKVYWRIVAKKSRQQLTVALSTTEAEYMASANATWQATWLWLLLEDLQVGLPVSINDNNGCIALSKNTTRLLFAW